LFVSKCKVVKVKVVLEDVGARENGVRTHAAQEYFPAHLKTKLQKRHL
jgi:hypothetical protein